MLVDAHLFTVNLFQIYYSARFEAYYTHIPTICTRFPSCSFFHTTDLRISTAC
jgi:hypothetical protein